MASNRPRNDDAEEPRRRRKPERKPLSGLLIAILALAVGIPVLACGGCLMIGLVGKKNDSSQAASEDPQGEVGKEIRFGPLGVTVERIHLGVFSATTSTGRVLRSDPNDPDLVVNIKFKNHDPTKRIKVNAQAGKATLVDEHGNEYPTMSLQNELGLKIKTDGAIEADHYKEFASDESPTDVLVFKKPVPGANTLTLTLDATQYGGKGKVRYVVGRDVFGLKK